MTYEDRPEIDDYSQLAGHENIKQEVRGQVQQEIAQGAAQPNPEISSEAHAVGHHLKERAINDVVRTESELTRARVMARVSQVIDYLFGIIYGIIALEIILDLAGARQSSGFKNFLDNLAAPLLAPFNGLMSDPAKGAYRLKLSYIVALVVYGLLHLAVTGLLRLVAQRRATI